MLSSLRRLLNIVLFKRLTLINPLPIYRYKGQEISRLVRLRNTMVTYPFQSPNAIARVTSGIDAQLPS